MKNDINILEMGVSFIYACSFITVKVVGIYLHIYIRSCIFCESSVAAIMSPSNVFLFKKKNLSIAS